MRLWLVISSLLVSLTLHAQTTPMFAETATQVRPLLNGQFVPNVDVTDEQGDTIKLMDLVSNKPSVILFYRGGWCPYCNRQMSGLVEVEQQLIQMGYQIIAISPDSPERLYEQRTRKDFQIVRVSDANLNAISAFGIGYFVAEDMVKWLKNKVGARFVREDGSQRVVLPVPAAFVVDTTGLIKFQYVNPNYKVRIEPQLLYHAARLSR